MEVGFWSPTVGWGTAKLKELQVLIMYFLIIAWEKNIICLRM